MSQESGKEFKFDDATASTEVSAVNTPGSATIHFGGTLTNEEKEAAAQEAIKKKAKEEAEQKAIVAAMENNINKWGDALTTTIKDIMKGGVKDETHS